MKATSREKDFLNLVAIEEGWALLERFATLVRESGTADEAAACDYIVSRLNALGVPVEVFEPELFISLPQAAELEIRIGNVKRQLRCKTPAFSFHTGGRSIEAPLASLPTSKTRDFTELFQRHLEGPEADVSGHIVVTEGFPMPTIVRALENRGALGAIFIHPGKNIHEMICTTIWGIPTPDNLWRKPKIPVVSINREDGDLVETLLNSSDGKALISTHLEEGWRKCKLPVVTIRGQEYPDEFLLVHGHYDSWHVGIGDNATGNATLLELARIFHARADLLRRSLKIAWWPAHSTGRYAGSTWFADRFAAELRRHCIGQLNIDSPGCAGATSFDEVMWMTEFDQLCRESIFDCTGKESRRIRPLRAGDYSFNQIGLSGFFMLLSNRPPAEREELGFYPVGGCGGNIAWHTEEDTLEVADPEILLQDLRIYVTAISRCLNSDVLPLDFRNTIKELQETVADYREAAGDAISLEPVEVELAALADRLSDFYRSKPTPSEMNRLLLALSRKLVPLNYSVGEDFDHDPAEPLGPLPKLRTIRQLSSYDRKSDEYKFLLNGLTRQRNKVVNILFESRSLLTTAGT